MTCNRYQSGPKKNSIFESPDLVAPSFGTEAPSETVSVCTKLSQNAIKNPNSTQKQIHSPARTLIFFPVSTEKFELGAAIWRWRSELNAFSPNLTFLQSVVCCEVRTFLNCFCYCPIPRIWKFFHKKYTITKENCLPGRLFANIFSPDFSQPFFADLCRIFRGSKIAFFVGRIFSKTCRNFVRIPWIKWVVSWRNFSNKLYSLLSFVVISFIVVGFVFLKVHYCVYLSSDVWVKCFPSVLSI